jgi:hypothetical protein
MKQLVLMILKNIRTNVTKLWNVFPKLCSDFSKLWNDFAQRWGGFEEFFGVNGVIHPYKFSSPRGLNAGNASERG